MHTWACFYNIIFDILFCDSFYNINFAILVCDGFYNNTVSSSFVMVFMILTVPFYLGWFLQKAKIASDRPCEQVAREGKLFLVRAVPLIHIFPETFYQVQKIVMFSQLTSTFLDILVVNPMVRQQRMKIVAATPPTTMLSLLAEVALVLENLYSCK